MLFLPKGNVGSQRGQCIHQNTIAIRWLIWQSDGSYVQTDGSIDKDGLVV